MKKPKIKIGDMVDISTGKGKMYRTLLEDMADNGSLIISTPLFRGMPVVLRANQELLLYFYREEGRYCIEARVEGFIASGKLRLISLIPLSEPKKQQRRESYRLKVSLDVAVRPFTGGGALLDAYDADDPAWERVLSNNLSETGISFNTFSEYYRGDQIYLKLQLAKKNQKSPPIELVAIVRQSEIADYATGKYRVGAEFLSLSSDVRRIISRYLLVRQQEYLKTEPDHAANDTQ